MRCFSSILLLLVFNFVSAQISLTDWPIIQGKPDLCGYTLNELPSEPALIWSIATNDKTQSSPVISDGTLFFGNEKGTLFAIRSDKTVLWKYNAGSPVTAPPLIYGDKVLFGTDNGLFPAVDKSTGKPVWIFKAENQILGSANAWTAGKREGIIFGSYDYFLYCLNPASGRLQWKIETENYINGTPAIADNKIVFGGCDGYLRIVDQVTGRVRDTINIGVYIAASPALYDQKAYFGDYDGNLYCFDLLKRKLCWRAPSVEGSGSIMSVPATNGIVVITGREDKYLCCYNAGSGKLLWKFRTNGKITGSAVLTQSKVLFGSEDGYVYLLSLLDGKKIWSFNTGSPVKSSPAISGERFYILTEDGRLLAFGNKNGLK